MQGQQLEFTGAASGPPAAASVSIPEALARQVLQVQEVWPSG